MADTHAAKILFAMAPWSSKLGRAPVVAEPCVGISAYREWMHQAGLVYRPCTAMDFDLNLVHFWRNLRNQGLQNTDEIKLGPQEGNIQQGGLLQSMSDAEGLIAGPPCQPFAATGLRQGAQDEHGRTDVFESTIDMICELGSRGSLLWFIVENSTCLADVTHAVFLNEMLLRLETSLPFFLVDTVKLDAAEFLPIRRGRFFIRGLRRDCLPDPMQANLPAPLCCSDLCLSVALEQILEPDLPATSEESLCPGHTANLALYKQTVLKASEEFAASGRALPSRTVVLELDRNPLKTFGGVWGWGKIPSLRTSGPQLFLLSCEDLSKPWQEMRLHRWLTLAERFRALGQRGTLAKHFAKDSHAIHAIGNALSPVQLAAVASPLVQAAVDSEVLRSSARCHRENVQTLVHTKPPGTSAGQVDLDPRRGFAKQASRKRGTKEPEPRNTEVFPEEADSKTQPSPEEKAPTTRKPKTKQAPKPKTRKPKTSYEKKAAKTPKPQASAEEEAPKTPKPQASAEEEAPKTPKPQASAEEEAPKTPKPQASAEEEAPKTPKHTPDDLELELERLIDEADHQEMDIASETEKSALPWGSRSMLSEKAAELFDSFTKATASRPANWSSPASKSADKESPEQSSGGKAGNTGSPEQSSGGKAGNTGSPEQSSRGKAGNTGSPEQSSGGKAGNTGTRRSKRQGGPDPAQRRLRFPANSILPAGVVHLSDSD